MENNNRIPSNIIESINTRKANERSQKRMNDAWNAKGLRSSNPCKMSQKKIDSDSPRLDRPIRNAFAKVTKTVPTWLGRLSKWIHRRKIIKQRQVMRDLLINQVFTTPGFKRDDPFLPDDDYSEKIDYSAYEEVNIGQSGRSGLYIDENADLYVNDSYVHYLLREIDRGESDLFNQVHHTGRMDQHGKYKMPDVIGIWLEDPFDVWRGRECPARLDTENEYFSEHFHSMQSYIDDNWDEEERHKIYLYLHTKKRRLGNIVVSSTSYPFSHFVDNPHVIINHDQRIIVPQYKKRSSSAMDEQFQVCTDGKYCWHETLEDFVLFYNVRPPQFFVDYILSQENTEEAPKENEDSILVHDDNETVPIYVSP